MTLPNHRKPSTTIEQYKLDSRARNRIRARLFEQVTHSWKVADFAGLRRCAWSVNDSREVILWQRIEALSDTELLDLWDGRKPQSEPQPRSPAEMLDIAKAQCFSSNMVQLHVPGYMLVSMTPTQTTESEQGS